MIFSIGFYLSSAFTCRPEWQEGMIVPFFIATRIAGGNLPGIALAESQLLSCANDADLIDS
jgi:Ni/Fe-hydrogenase subunit HybB-like protein